ncbi:amidohydrolase [Candidatus Woesearchaeota archaeon]|nr:amidohydrolase [Candidatus Woesearchaeota archaeon]MBW3022095.1 amidohydrolase [Candidatus Woesearchaeota archaeon]
MAQKIFDSHSHIGKFGKWNMKGNLVEPFVGREITNAKEQKVYMTDQGVTKAIVVPHYTPDQNIPFDVYNPIVVDVSAKLENVYGGLWVSPLKENTEKTTNVLKSLPLKKIVALKISPDSWPKGITPDPKTWDKQFKINMENIIKAAKDHDLVIQTHTGSNNSDILNYVPFIEKYGKGLKIQFVHMGGSAGGHFAFVPRFIEWLKQGHDFYCDTSFCKGFAPAWLVREMLKKYPKGINNILFASDNPWGLFKSEYWRIEGIDCDRKIKNKILYENADKLYS